VTIRGWWQGRSQWDERRRGKKGTSTGEVGRKAGKGSCAASASEAASSSSRHRSSRRRLGGCNSTTTTVPPRRIRWQPDGNVLTLHPLLFHLRSFPRNSLRNLVSFPHVHLLASLLRRSTGRRRHCSTRVTVEADPEGNRVPARRIGESWTPKDGEEGRVDRTGRDTSSSEERRAVHAAGRE
jgi:hypothetical protein